MKGPPYSSVHPEASEAEAGAVTRFGELIEACPVGASFLLCQVGLPDQCQKSAQACP